MRVAQVEGRGVDFGGERNYGTVAGVWMWCTPWLRGRGGESTSPRISIPSATIFLHDTLFSIPRSLDLPVYLGRISHLQNFLITFSSLIPSLDNRTKNNNRRACTSERLA